MKCVYTLLIAALITNATFGQNENDSLIPKGQMEGVKAMKFISAINHQQYILLVKLPDSYNDTVKKHIL